MKTADEILAEIDRCLKMVDDTLYSPEFINAYAKAMLHLKHFILQERWNDPL